MRNSICSHCKRSVAPEAVYCPHCGSGMPKPSDSGQGGQGLILLGIVGVVVIAALVLYWQASMSRDVQTQAAVSNTVAVPEAQGVDQQLGARINELTALHAAAKQAIDHATKDDWHEKYESAKRVYDRMVEAYDRANDENRWPVQLAGVSFDEKKARAVIDLTRQYVEKNKLAFQRHDANVARLSDALPKLAAEIEKLRGLRVAVTQSHGDNPQANADALAHLKEPPGGLPRLEEIRTAIDEMNAAHLQPLDLDRILKQ